MAYIAIDIGGSMIKAAVITVAGEIVDRTSEKTPMDNYKTLINVLSGIVEWSQTIDQIEGIALSQPCATDEVTGQCLSEGALIFIKGENPARDLGTMYNLPYSAENDGNCAAIAEVWLGSAKDVSDMAFVVCGTGVGGALVKQRKIHAGLRKFAGEFGMMIIGHDLENGFPLMWSDCGSTYALVRRYAKAIGVDTAQINGKLVFERAGDGDEKATQCIRDFYRYFALGLHNIQHVYDPEVILIGGGISTREEIVEEINTELKELYKNCHLAVSMPNVRRCTFEADANLVGAVYHHISVDRLQ